MAKLTPEEERRKYVEGWNATMLDIWREKIKLYDVFDTGALFRSLSALPLHADGRFMSFDLSQTFLEYGLWQDLGTGKEVAYGNPGNIGRDKVREPRRWFSPKYFYSERRLCNFLASSMGDEFKIMINNALDSDEHRRQSNHYKRKGYV